MSIIIKLAAPAEVSVPVSVKVPGGATNLLLTARHKGPHQYMAWLATWGQRSDLDLLMDVITGWGAAVGDPEGGAVPFSRESLADLLDQVEPELSAAERAALPEGAPAPSLSVAILKAYAEALAEGRRGN